MEKIEEQIIKTFEVYCNNNNYNMEITLSPHDKVEGYGNDRAIFRYEPKGQRFSFTMAGYNTPTTRGRLRALLDYFCGVHMIEGRDEI